MRWSVYFSTSVANETENLNICWSLKNLLVLIYSKLHEKNHVITYTYSIKLYFETVELITLIK